MVTVAQLIAERLERIGLELPVNRENKEVRFVHAGTHKSPGMQDEELICVVVGGKAELMMTIQKLEQLGQQCILK